MAQFVLGKGEAFEADLVVPVPFYRFYRSRERERWVNQAAPLAEPLPKALRLPYGLRWVPTRQHTP